MTEDLVEQEHLDFLVGEDAVVVDRYRRMEWENDQSTNAVVACPNCGDPHLRLLQMNTTVTAVHVVMKCTNDHCGSSALHLGISEQALPSGRTYVKLVTD